MTTFEQMIEHGHERVCFHQDPESGLRAIVAIHSTVLGNALGGTRRWCYATEADAVHDVLRLSEGMTYKAAAAGLPMGGGKSVIMLPKPRHQPTEAEARAMGRFVDTFNGAYIAAEDVGVNTQFVDWMAMETNHVMGGETVSVGGDPSPYTARGVVNAMRGSLSQLGRPVDFSGVHVAIQGVGSVGYNIARILHEEGATLTVADINEDNIKRIHSIGDVTITDPESILTTSCDILAPCALGGVIDGKNASKLRCKIVCGAANNILDDPDEDSVVVKNAGILYAPDFVANAGGLIRLAGLYLGMSEGELNQKIEDIEPTLRQILADAEQHGMTAHAAAIKFAREKIEEGGKKSSVERMAGGQSA